MDVTKQNFREVFEEIKETIDKAAFFVIDGEFTGCDAENNILPYDTPEEYYKKINKNSENYILIQLGLTVFRLDETNTENLKCKSYNFYVYPRGRKNTFKCQGQSLEFLAENGFDFNKLFRDGITYTNLSEADSLRERMLEKHANSIPSTTTANNDSMIITNQIPIPDGDKEWFAETEKEIDEMLNSDKKEIVIDNRNGFQRKLIYQLVETSFQDQVSTETRMLEGNRRALVIRKKLSKEEEQVLADERLKKLELEIQDLIGITNVMKLVSQSRKLIVGHNMLLDLMFILRQCFGPTPDNFKEFKHFAHEIFPNLLDTKYICSLEKFKTIISSSVLSHLYESVTKAPFKIPTVISDSESHAYSMDSKMEHNAGFDSYMTGMVFLALAKYMDMSFKEIANLDSKHLNKVKNKIFCMRLQDVCYINMMGPEPKPDRGHVFHIEFPSTWKQNDIVNHFREFGQIFISWINDTSAMVAIQEREFAGIVMKRIGHMSGVKVQPFNDYKNGISTECSSGGVIKKTPESKYVVNHLSNRKRHNPDLPQSDVATKKIFSENDNWDVASWLPNSLKKIFFISSLFVIIIILICFYVYKLDYVCLNA